MALLPKVLLPGALLVLLSTLPVQAATLWYSGDNDGSLTNQVSITGGAAENLFFEDFAVPDSAGWQVDSVFSNNFSVSGAPSKANWAILSGVSAGTSQSNLGTVIASGLSDTTVTPTGRTATNSSNSVPNPEYTFTVSGLNISLEPGKYYLTVTPSGISTPSATQGANAIGINDSGNFRVSATRINPLIVSPEANDFSLGLTGVLRGESTSVPEPLPAPWLIGMVPLGLGLLKGRFSALKARAKNKIE